MDFANQQKEIIISNSNVPIIRAGFSNILLFLLFIASIVTNQILNEFDASLMSRILIILLLCVVVLRIYCHSVSRIDFKDESRIVIVGPIFKSEVDVSKIVKFNIFGIPSSMTIFFTVEMKKVKLPKWYYFIAVSTNIGSYDATKTTLNEITREWEKVGKRARP